MKQTLALVLERAHCKYCSSQIRLQKDIVFDCTAYYSLTVTADHSCPVESHEHEKGGGREGMDSSERYSALDCWSLVSVQHILDLISHQQVQTSGRPNCSKQYIWRHYKFSGFVLSCTWESVFSYRTENISIGSWSSGGEVPSSSSLMQREMVLRLLCFRISFRKLDNLPHPLLSRLCVGSAEVIVTALNTWMS